MRTAIQRRERRELVTMVAGSLAILLLVWHCSGCVPARMARQAAPDAAWCRDVQARGWALSAATQGLGALSASLAVVAAAQDRDRAFGLNLTGAVIAAIGRQTMTTEKYQHCSELPGYDEAKHFAPGVIDGREYFRLCFVARGQAVQLNEVGEPMSDGEWRVYSSKFDANLPHFAITVYLHYPWVDDIAESRDSLHPNGGMVMSPKAAVDMAVTLLEAAARSSGRDPQPIITLMKELSLPGNESRDA